MHSVGRAVQSGRLRGSCVTLRYGSTDAWASTARDVLFCAFCLRDPEFLPWIPPLACRLRRAASPPRPRRTAVLGDCPPQTPCARPGASPPPWSVFWLSRTLSGTFPVVMGCLSLRALRALSLLLFSKLVSLPLSFLL